MPTAMVCPRRLVLPTLTGSGSPGVPQDVYGLSCPLPAPAREPTWDVLHPSVEDQRLRRPRRGFASLRET